MIKPTSRKKSLPALPSEEPGISMLRWVKRADGEMAQVELPLTPGRFLNPRVGDQMFQGQRHFETVVEIHSLLKDHFQADPGVLVTGDMKHFLAPDLPAPGPDVSVIRGVRVKNDARRFSFRVKKEDVRPCLIVEVVSPLDPRLRQTDLETKVEVYQEAGVAEYLIADSADGSAVSAPGISAGRLRPVSAD